MNPETIPRSENFNFKVGPLLDHLEWPIMGSEPFVTEYFYTFLGQLYVYYYMMTYALLPNSIESILAPGLDELLVNRWVELVFVCKPNYLSYNLLK